MYNIGHNTIKLDGIITEFADIYAPLAQIWKWETVEVFQEEDISLEEKKQGKSLMIEDSDSL